MPSVLHRDVIKDDFGGKLPSGRPFHPDVRPRPRLPGGRGFTRGRVFTICRRRKNCVRADAGVHPCGREKKNLIFFGSCCQLGKREFFFNFQSPNSPNSPNSPSSPSSPGFAGEAARKRRFFWPSSPSHPSKLYSSLGLLNSKVPKPFFPFIPRLIDVDGF
jgi:hypothetical protein